MTQNSHSEKPTLFPYPVYRDADTAFNWLANVFGFMKTAEVLGPDGHILHAELSFDADVVMLGTASDKQLKQSHWNLPSGQGIYVYVEDLDTHYEKARANGAKIVYPPENTQWGTRRYRALDLDGYEWSFGTYRPSGEEK